MTTYTDEIAKGLTRVYTQNSLHEGVELADMRMVILSDLHKGQRDRADDFQGCERTYLAAADHYWGDQYELLLRVSFRSPGAVVDLSPKFGCDPEDLAEWGFDEASLWAPYERESGTQAPKRTLNSYTFQRKVMLALKKDIDTRPHGKLVRRVKYYCDVLLRE